MAQHSEVRNRFSSLCPTSDQTSANDSFARITSRRIPLPVFPALPNTTVGSYVRQLDDDRNCKVLAGLVV